MQFTDYLILFQCLVTNSSPTVKKRNLVRKLSNTKRNMCQDQDVAAKEIILKLATIYC